MLTISPQNAIGFFLGVFHRFFGRHLADDGGFQTVVEYRSHPLVLISRKFRRGVLQLIAGNQRRREIRCIRFHRRRLPGVGARCDITGGDGPFSGLLGRGNPFDEVQRGFFLFVAGFLENLTSSPP